MSEYESVLDDRVRQEPHAFRPFTDQPASHSAATRSDDGPAAFKSGDDSPEPAR
jgi:hypothetical protein